LVSLRYAISGEGRRYHARGDGPMKIDFARNEGASLGIEVELSLVDRRSGELVSAASDILRELGAPHPEGVHPKAKNELFECTLEIITGVCDTVAEAKADLTETLALVQEAAERRGLVPISVGAHPFSRWQDQEFTPSERYLELVEEMQWTARRLLIFGIHFHVGVRSPERAIAFVNVLKQYIPHFLVLSASSPFWDDEDSGLASARTKVFETLPTAGLPPTLEGWSEFEQLMQTFMQARCIRSIREIWWDLRPHPDFGTVEFRICDGVPTLREIAALAALAQCLVQWLDDRFDTDEFPETAHEWIIKENKWLAARHGLDAELIVNDRGHKQPVPDLVTRLVDELGPVAERLGCAAELADVLTILDTGASYQRQRRIIEAGGTGVDVVAALARELATDTPEPT
jgi:carboxylate-amine ligase